jgi:hypothetical protein
MSKHVSTGQVYIAAGLAVAATLVGVGGQLPWAALALWLIAWVLVLHVSIRSSHWHPVLRIGMAAVTVALALAVWQATNPRADIRVVELVPVRPGGERLGSLDVSIVFQNMGEWRADAKAVSRIGLFETVPLEDVQRREALEERVRLGLGDAPGSSALVFQLAPRERRFYTVTGDLSTEQTAALSAGRLTAYIAAEVRYRDWWIRERGIRVCAFISGSSHTVAQCLRHTDSW